MRASTLLRRVGGVSRRLSLLLAVGLLAGCPRETTEPMRPMGRACVTDDDCTPAGAGCGLVFACVDERCEEQASRSEPCD